MVSSVFVVCYEIYYLDVVFSFFCSPVFCPRLELLLLSINLYLQDCKGKKRIKLYMIQTSVCFNIRDGYFRHCPSSTAGTNFGEIVMSVFRQRGKSHYTGKQ